MSSYAYTSKYKELPGKAPVILVGPYDKNTYAGSKVKFACSAKGDEPLQYQWYKDDSPIAGAESSEYIIKEAVNTHAGFYHCIVSNKYGTAETEQAKLSVEKYPPDWDPDNPFPGPKPSDWGEDPEDADSVWKLSITDIPSLVFLWVKFPVTVTAYDVNDTGEDYTGEGARIEGFLVQDGKIIPGSVAHESWDISDSSWPNNEASGDTWFGGEFLREGATSVKLIPWIEDTHFLTDDEVSYIGDSANVDVAIPAFVPILPDSLDSVSFDYNIECRDSESGSVLTGYVRNGRFLNRTWYGKDETTGEWEELSADQVDDGDIYSGWSNGVWTGSVQLSGIFGYSDIKVEISIEYTESAYSDSSPIDLDVILKNAIDERETAVGVTGLDPANSYTLSELKSYVNNIAPNYIADNSYNGGSAKPTMLSSSYADSAEDKSELYALVKEMLISLTGDEDSGGNLEVNAGNYGLAMSDHYYDFISGTNQTKNTELAEPKSWETLANEAEATYEADDTWSLDTSDDNYYRVVENTFWDDWYEYSNEDEDYGEQTAFVDAVEYKYNAGTLTTDISHKLMLYIKAEPPSISASGGDEEKETFAAQGCNVEKDVYVKSSEDNNYNTDSSYLLFGRTLPGPYWPVAPDAVDEGKDWNEYFIRGWRVYSVNMFMLAEWDFAYT